MLKVYPILIVQTSRLGYDSIYDELKEAKFPELSYLLTSYPRDIERRIIPGERQLLVIGIFSNNQWEENQFIRRMKDLNPRLIVANFSIQSIFGEPYDMTISKDCPTGFCCHLIRVMRRFLLEANTQ
ncbi:MAG: hypothetical protein WAX85_03210 [Minisyncoccia bacterium]